MTGAKYMTQADRAAAKRYARINRGTGPDFVYDLLGHIEHLEAEHRVELAEAAEKGADLALAAWRPLDPSRPGPRSGAEVMAAARELQRDRVKEKR